MSWFERLKATFCTDGGVNHLPKFIPVSAHTPDDEKRERVNSLTPEEFEVYKWLREGYTLKWTAETLCIDINRIRACAKRVYHRLGVKDQRGLISMYGVLDKDIFKIDVPFHSHGLMFGIMSRLDDLRVLFQQKEDKIVVFSEFEQISADITDDEKRDRVNTLGSTEFAAYKWLREGYTLKWIAEILSISLDKAQTYEKNVYRKLGVKDQRGIIRLYGLLDKERPEVVVLPTPDD